MKYSRGLARRSATILTALSCIVPIYSASFSNFVETPETLSFDFEGNGDNDYWVLDLPPLTYWKLSSNIRATGTPWLEFFTAQHLADGPILPIQVVGDLGLPGVTPATPSSQTQTAPHGIGIDEFSFTMKVDAVPLAPGIFLFSWGDFSGSFSAKHVTGVPDSGVGVAGLAVVTALLILSRKRPQQSCFNLG
jgi:hypothetical protein